MEGLSERDKAILQTIFDPFQTSGINVSEKDQESSECDPADQPDLDPDTTDIIKKAIRYAEINEFEECFKLFDEALNKVPNSPSILNDRAQALRLAGRNDDALKDLNLAVDLSQGKGRSGMQALTQRGILYRCMEMNKEAKEDFRLAAKKGSDFATSQLIDLDPYVEMNNAVFQEITRDSY